MIAGDTQKFDKKTWENAVLFKSSDVDMNEVPLPSPGLLSKICQLIKGE